MARHALRDLDDIYDYTAQGSVPAARRNETRIRAAAQRLGRFPESGRAGRIDGTRELVVPGLPYIVIYRIEDAGVLVLSVRHGARDWPAGFVEA